jgi:hypothetical protein
MCSKLKLVYHKKTVKGGIAKKIAEENCEENVISAISTWLRGRTKFVIYTNHYLSLQLQNFLLFFFQL